MLARGVTLQELEQVAALVGGVKIVDAREEGVKVIRVRFRLGLTDERYRKYNSISGRRIHAVCWHGHRDFLRMLFDRNPNAVVETMLATYSGQQDFEDRYTSTAYNNTGGIMLPRYACQQCIC